VRNVVRDVGIHDTKIVLVRPVYISCYAVQL
jgi:hypothetical protein